MRGAELADQVHRADVDAKLERSGRHHGAQLAALQAGFRFQTQRPRQASVMRQNNAGPKALRKVMGHALGQTPGVDENQRGAALADQLGQAIVDFVPHLIARHRAQFALGNFDK